MELYPPLELLLKMYFTPYFPKEDVEKEKGIILSEIKMHEDDIQSKFFYQTLKALYPNSAIAIDATGTVQGVKKLRLMIFSKHIKNFIRRIIPIWLLSLQSLRKRFFPF